MATESHPCVTPGCTMTVPYDGEPWCFTHSPDSGSFVPGYSYAAGDKPPEPGHNISTCKCH
jgi:hypothetical protein